MKNILILTNEFYPFRGGIGRYCEEIALEASKKANVEVFCPSYGGKSESFPSSSVKVNSYSGGKFKFSDFPKVFFLLYKFDFKKYDKILVADWPVWICLAVLNNFFFKKINFILVVYGSEVLIFNSGRLSWFTKRISMFNGAVKIVPISQYTKKLLYKYFGRSIKCPVEVTYLGVSVDETIEPLVKGSKNTCFEILTVGRLDSRKGHFMVVDAISKLPRDYIENIIYTIVGTGDSVYRNELLKYSVDKRVSLRIRSDVSDEQLKAIYNGADVFALAARTELKKVEGFGLVFLEAAQFGLPSVATNVGAVPEIVINMVTGLVVEENSDEFMRAVKRLYDDRDLLRALGRKSREGLSKFQWKETVKKTFDL